jgi:hypothetical protein
VKELAKLKAVDALENVGWFANEKVAKAAIEGLEAMFQEFVKEKNVYALNFLAINASEDVAKEAVEALGRLKAEGTLISLVWHREASEEVVKAAIKALRKLNAETFEKTEATHD